MLRSLSIKNFALIEELQVTFDAGLITITGETGAGKSLLLGALGLLLGKRADLSTIKDTTKKCLIEGAFTIEAYELQSLFEEEDLDYESETIIRREILPSGKSRAFVNDTPVTLQSLSILGSKLIDIHSQHQTLEVTTNDFQFQVVDALASAEREIASYKRGLKLLKANEKEYKLLLANQSEFKKEFEYNSYLLDELLEAKLKVGELLELEEKQETLSNVEEIRERLSNAIGSISAEEMGISDMLSTARNQVSKIAGFSGALEELSTRIQSLHIELEDIAESLQGELEGLEADPQQLELVSGRLQLLYDLQTKHSVSSVEELLQIQESLTQKVQKTESISEDIHTREKEIGRIKKQLDDVAVKIHAKREKALPKLVGELQEILAGLGMPNASFDASLLVEDTYYSNGKEQLQFLFSANKGGAYGELKKTASGGELSRIMIGIKAILSRYIQLPTIIFDEIDTGVSGEVAHMMANLMTQMSENLQVFSITHLPQIAANGQTQYKVYKEDVEDVTVTQLKLLSYDDRVQEIAEMIGGKSITESALTHAASLLKGVRS